MTSPEDAGHEQHSGPARRRRMLLRLLLPSTPCAVGLLAFAGVCLTPEGVRLFGWDTPLHLYLGEHMLRQGARVTTDPGIWAVKGFYIDHEWLLQLALAAVHLALGLEGLVLFTALGVGATFWLVAVWVRERGVGAPIALALLASAFFVLRPFFLARPFLATWFLAVLWTLLLDRLSRGELAPGRWLAVAVPLMWVWTNLHGGFFLGFFLLGIFGLAQLWRIATSAAAERREATQLLLWMAIGGNLCLIVSAFNAYGIKLHIHFVSYLASSDLITRIGEWRALSFHQGRQLPLLLWIGFSVFVWLAGPRRLTPTQLLLVVGLLLSALKAARNLPVFVILTLPIVGVQLEALLRQLAGSSSLAARPALWIRELSLRTAAGERRRRGTLVAAAVLLIAIQAIGIEKIKPVDLSTKYPVAAARFIRENPQTVRGRMFNRYRWGGYLAWELLPTHRVFINGLQDHYGGAHDRNYHNVVRVLPGWNRFLLAAGIDWVIDARDTALTAVLDIHPGWRRVYQDDDAEIYVRQEAVPETGEHSPPRWKR